MINDFDFRIASYADWHNESIASNVWDCLEAHHFCVTKVDRNDPPRKSCDSKKQFVTSWNYFKEKENSSWVFFNCKGDKKLGLVAKKYDSDFIRKGYYNELYAGITNVEQGKLGKLMYDLCIILKAHHGLVDREVAYNVRAHSIGQDGAIKRSMNSFIDCLPGLFAYNYFGPVYQELIRNAINSGLAQPAKSGVTLTLPNGDSEIRDQGYLDSELSIINLLGKEYFRNPKLNWTSGKAPKLEEFLAAANMK